MRYILLILFALLLAIMAEAADNRQCQWVLAVAPDGVPSVSARPGSGTVEELCSASKAELDDSSVFMTVNCIQPGQKHPIDLHAHFKK